MTDSNTPIDSFDGEFQFLSNFWPVPVSWAGILFPSVEHAYQASKTADPAIRRDIARCATPGQAKRAGKLAPKREDWETVKLSMMALFLERKFADPVLRQMLLATGVRPLIEGNTWGDRFWGVCGGVGENHLGRLLMELRTRLSYVG